MAILVTLQEAVSHLKSEIDAGTSPLSAAADDLQMKLDVAEAMCLAYVKDRRTDQEDWIAEVNAWTREGSPAEEPPLQIRLAILEMVAYLDSFRGNDLPADQPKQQDGQLPFFVRMHLDPFRDPTLA